MTTLLSHFTTVSSVSAGERRSDRKPLITPYSLRWALVHAFCWFVLWGTTGAAPAAAQATGALIVGTITDMEGAALPSVAVTARNLETGTTRKTVSENDGQYRLDGLQPGTYYLEAEREGFAITTVNNILLTVNLEFKEPSL